MYKIAIQTLLAVAAAWMIASPAAGQEGFERTIVGIEDDGGALAIAVELSLKVYQPLTSPRRHGAFLVDTEIQPGTAEETVLRYMQLVGSGDTAGYTGLHEPDQGNGLADELCPCGSRSGPNYRIPDRFKLLMFEWAWLYRNYTIFQISFRESANRSSGVNIATRLHDGKVYIAARPRGHAFEAASFLLWLAEPGQGLSQPSAFSPGDLERAAQIDGGANPLMVHFGGTLHSSSVGWQPAERSNNPDRVATFAAEILATSTELDEDAFVNLFHPWVSDSLRSRADRDPGYLEEARRMYSATSDIAHVFTFEIGRRLLHTYATEDQPDRLRHMLIMKDGQDLA